MEFCFLGIHYKQAPLDVRDRTAFTDIKKMEFIQQAGESGIRQCLIVSTCNRSEVFFFYEEEREREQMRKLYETMFPDVALEPYMRVQSGDEALEHLYRMTAGMESLVVGEDQILGQVREAFDFSRTMGCSGKELNKVVLDAITCAKKIKTELKVSEQPLSVSYIGVKRLDELMGITHKKVLIIGSGKTAVLALKYMYEYGAGQVTVCSRTFSHASGLRRQFPDISVIQYEERYACMETCDIVVSATSSPHLVVRKEEFVPGKPMVFLDLATPRDIDLSLAEDDRVQVINLDSLQQTARENGKERQKRMKQGEKFIREELEATRQWLQKSRVDATIQSLQQRCDGIVQDSYDYLNRKLHLCQREQKLVKKVLHASLQRLLREPIQELKQLDTTETQDEYQKMLRQLFRMSEEE